MPLNDSVSYECDATYDLATSQFVTDVVAYTQGVEGDVRVEAPGYNSGIMSIMMAMILIVVFNMRHSTHFIKAFVADLWNVRRRANAFDDHTLNETRIMLALVCQVCVCEGLLLFSAQWFPSMPNDAMLPLVGGMIGVAITYYLCQVGIYYLIGYVFSDRIGMSQWLRGFNATQMLLGFMLLMPVFVALFYPRMSVWMLAVSGVMYVMARIVFVCKG
ncbi:MAG: DUF4271 domain-containing protein, partial [Muribaculaceae bacterium]|nr:DUF4271 domain-containing protein [Muribaculaceae bacterium]